MGRWIDQKEEAFVDFLDHQVCAEVTKSPENVVVYRWTQEGAKVTMEPVSKNWVPGLKPPVRQNWSVNPHKDGIRLVSSDGRVRRFRKVTNSKVDASLVGVWRNRRRWIVYSPEGEAISLLYLPARKGSTVPGGFYGEWFQYQVAEGRVRFDGYSPLVDRRGFGIPYEITGDTLTLKFVPKPGVWQKASQIDWADIQQ